MTLNRIILEALAKNPLGLKEALSTVLAERIGIALEEKIADLSENEDQMMLKQIHKDYHGYKALPTETVLKHHKGLNKIKGNYSAQEVGGKEAMIGDLLRSQHGDKKVTKYFGLKKTELSSLKEEINEGVGLKFRPFQRDEWNTQAKAMGYVIKPAVDPEGNSSNLMLAKDKQGNHRGSFHAKNGGHLNEASKRDSSMMARSEKQAVRAAEKANVGAMPRADKESWIDQYIADNGISKGALGSAVYSGVMKVRALVENLAENTFKMGDKVKYETSKYSKDNSGTVHSTEDDHVTVKGSNWLGGDQLIQVHKSLVRKAD